MAASFGMGLNANVPPANPVILAVPPSQVGVMVKEGLSAGRTENV
ncbi:MAG: hypothetical protein R2797_05630 [Gelidibacter sp.]